MAVPGIEFKSAPALTNKDKQRLIISGSIVNLDSVLNHTRWRESCTHDTLKEISIIGMEKVCFDADLNFQGKEILLSIVAPEWEVVVSEGKPNIKILLDGVQPPDFESDAESGANYGDNGRNGKAGRPGGNAGSFFGVFMNIKNGEKLLVSANGGNGGKGQNGGNGKEGRRGADASFDDFPPAVTMAVQPLHPPFLIPGYFENGQLLQSPTVITAAYSHLWFSLLGKAGQPGGKGGNGGDGGAPGLPGILQIIRVNSNQLICNHGVPTSNQPGNWGEDGNGGQGGEGGLNGNHYSSCLHFYTPLGVPIMHWGRGYVDINPDPTRPGDRGANGISRQRTILIPSHSSVSEWVPGSWTSMYEYRTMAFGQFSESAETFINGLNHVEKISSRFLVKYFAGEVLRLEENFYLMSGIEEAQKHLLYRSYYECLLNRLASHTEYYLQTHHPTLVDADKLALNIIYSTVLGKLTSFNMTSNQLNVIKTKEYIDAIIGQLDSIKTTENARIINQERDKFGAILESKQKAVENLLKDTVLPAIEKVECALEKANSSLLSEINSFLDAAEKTVENQKLLKSEFESAMVKKIALDVLTTLGVAASFFGPPGIAAGQGILIGVSIAKWLSPCEGEPSSSETSALPEAFTSALSKFNKAYYNKKITLLKRKLELAKAVQTSVGKESLAEIETKMGIAECEYDRLIVEVLSNQDCITEEMIGKICKLEEKQIEIEELLQNLIADMEAEKGGGGPGQNDNLGESHAGDATGGQTNSPLDPVGAAQKEHNDAVRKQAENKTNIKKALILMRTAEAGFEIIETIQGSQNKMDKLCAMVMEAEENVRAVNAKKEAFYTTLIPQMVSMECYLKNAIPGARGQSIAALAVKKWEIKKLLKGAQRFLQEFTKGLKVTEEFCISFNMLDEALTLMIDLHEHIAKYEEKKELANFIANVNSAGDRTLAIPDDDLRSTLVHLEFFIQANLFLEEYQRALHAFKQWAFPFANNYLAEKTHQENMRIDRNTSLDRLCEIYGTEVTNLSNKLETYAATTTNYDQWLKEGAFTSDSVSSKPFFIWTNSNFKASIIRFLNGEKIRLKADLDEMSENDFFRHKSAVKFKQIRLKIQNHERQKELDRMLKHFQINMTHSGISIYYLMGQKYVMFDKSQLYSYTFDKKDNQSVFQSVTASKETDYLMSPFTWWTFQLEKANSESRVTFSDLSKFKEEVDLKLEGFGIYLDETKAKSLDDLKLADYYEAYDSESETIKRMDEGLNTNKSVNSPTHQARCCVV